MLNFAHNNECLCCLLPFMTTTGVFAITREMFLYLHKNESDLPQKKKKSSDSGFVGLRLCICYSSPNLLNGFNIH